MEKSKLLIVLAITSLAISGCGTAAAVSDKASGSQPAQSANGDQQKQTDNQQSNPSPNAGQREMLVVFQGLMSMDKQTDLKITKDEASKMLPIAQSVVSAKQITDEQVKQLEGLLTDNQKKYLTDRLDQVKQNSSNRSGQTPGTGGNRQPREKADQSGSGNTQQPPHARQRNSDSTPQKSQQNSQQKSSQNGSSNRGFANMADQFVQMLQERTQQS